MLGTIAPSSPRSKRMSRLDAPFESKRRASCFVSPRPRSSKQGLKPALFGRACDDMDFDKKKNDLLAKAAAPKNAFYMPTALSDVTSIPSRTPKAGVEEDERAAPRQNVNAEHSAPRRISAYEKMFNEITRGYMKESEVRRGCLMTPMRGVDRRQSVQVNARRQSMSNADRAAWGLPPLLFTQHSTASAALSCKSDNDQVPPPLCVSMKNRRRSLVVFGRTSLEKRSSARNSDATGSGALSRMRRVEEVDEHRLSSRLDRRDSHDDNDKDEDDLRGVRHSDYGTISVRFRESSTAPVSAEAHLASVPLNAAKRRVTSCDVSANAGGFVSELRSSVLSNKRYSTESMQRDSVLAQRSSAMSECARKESAFEEIIITFHPVLDVIALRKWLTDGIQVTRRNIESLAHLYQYAMRYMLLPPESTFGDFTRDVESGRKDVLRVMLRDNTPYVSRTVRRAKALAKESGRYLTLTLDQQLTELFHMQYHYKTITSARAMIARKTFNPTPKKKKRKVKRYNKAGGWVMEAKQLAMETAEQKDSLWSKINTYFHVRNHIKMVLKSTCSVQSWHDFVRSPVKPAKPNDGLRALPRDRMRWLISNPDPYGRKAKAKFAQKPCGARKKNALFPVLAAPVWNFAPRMTREELFKTVLTEGDLESSGSDTSYSSDDEVDDSESSASSSSASSFLPPFNDSPNSLGGFYRRHTLDSDGVSSPRTKCERDSVRRLSGRDTLRVPASPTSSFPAVSVSAKDRWKQVKGLLNHSTTAPTTPPHKMKFALNENKPTTNQGFIEQMMNHVGANDRGNVQGPLLQRRQSIEMQRRNSVDIDMPTPVRIQGKNGESMVSIRMTTTPLLGAGVLRRPDSSAELGSGMSSVLSSQRRSSVDERRTGMEPSSSPAS